MGKFVSVPLRGFNNYDVKSVSDECVLVCPEATLAQQHFREECDINTIVERFGLTGELPQGVSMPRYGDFTFVSDYRTALDAVIAADDAFMRMPPKVRARFENDPALFVDFCSDPANLEEARSLGLVPERAPIAPASSGTQAKPGESAPAGSG